MHWSDFLRRALLSSLKSQDTSAGDLYVQKNDYDITEDNQLYQYIETGLELGRNTFSTHK